MIAFLLALNSTDSATAVVEDAPNTPTFVPWLLLAASITLILLVVIALLLRGQRRSHVANEVARAEREANLQLRSIADTANLVLTRFDRDGQLVYLSPGIRRLTGISAAQFVAGNAALKSVVHPEDMANFDKARIAREKGSLENIDVDYRVSDKRGRWHWLHVRQSPMFTDDELRGYNAIAVDFTDHVRFNQQQHRLLHLRKLSTQILESFLATTDTAKTTEKTLDLACTYFDLSAASLWERENDQSDFVRTHSWKNNSITTPSTSQRTEDAESIDSDQTEWWIDRLHNGSPLSITPDTCSAEDKAAIANLTGAGATAVLVVPALVLGGMRLMIVLEAPEESREWEPEELDAIQTMASAIARSIERVHAETERAEFEETRRGHERSEIIAHLASGIAHDFNNIVFAVSGRVQLLRRRTEDEQTQQSLDEILKTLQGAKGIIGALLAMHRGGDRRDGTVRIGPEIRAMSIMIRRLIPKRIKFEVVTKVPDTAEVQITTEALQQTLMNLVINARDAVASGGQIIVTLEKASDDDELILMHVDDDGPGIPMSQRVEVFKPFVTTKDPSRGTGLGLSIVQRVIREHGGSIELSDSPLGGLRVSTSFIEVSPRQTSESEKASPFDPANADISRVLIVEDDDVIRKMLTGAFESSGIDVIDRGDALGIGALLVKNNEEIDVLVMDIDLPRKTGIECLYELRAAGINTPCVLITGSLADAPADIQNVTLLRKPFPIEKLEMTCRTLVAAHRQSSD